MCDLLAVHCFKMLEHLSARVLVAALSAGESCLLSVGLEVLFLVGYLVERLMTAIYWAYEGFLTSVCP